MLISIFMNIVSFLLYKFILITFINLSITPLLNAAETKVAVASNFITTMKEVKVNFSKNSPHEITIISGSTGKLYAQILQNAPFDIFLSADQRRPELLVEKQVARDQFTYAIGKLVLWSSDREREINEATLGKSNYRKIALANPKTAPYGEAALEVIKHLDVENMLAPKQVFGENIAQTYQFVATGNAQLGFISSAQIAFNDSGTHWNIPQSFYQQIRQDAVLLRRGEKNPAARAFFEYLKSDRAKGIIQKYGYATE